MKVRLLADDSKMPNLAIMKISAYHKNLGDDVDWYIPIFDSQDTDILYHSRIFNFTPEYQYYPQNAKTIINDTTIITGRLLAGQYPNVSQLLKITQGYELKNIDKQELLSKINLGKLVGGEVNIQFNQNEITFYGNNEYNSILENSKLDNFNLYINLDYFNITLNVLKNNNVDLYYKSELSPIIFTENDKMIMIR